MATEPADPALMPPVGSAADSSQSITPASDTTAPSSPFPIVGVGSSAGGLNALTIFLSKLPTNTGMAFVLIQHLDPTQVSQLPGILSRHTRLPILAANDGVEVLPDHIYIIKPNTSLAVEQGILRTTPRDESPRPHLVIDFFFQSLARVRPGRIIGVILSGTGSDGTLGLAAIKTAGGITFAQDDTAEHSGMPSNAIDHGCVDLVLPPDEIAREIEKIASSGFPAIREALPILAEKDMPDGDGDIAVLPEDSKPLVAIIEMIRTQAGIDFTQYRPTTIKRRILRRLSLLDLPSLEAYERFIVGHPEEIAALVKDLLINVTSFYRDAATFAALSATVFPLLMRDRQPTDTIRIWVAGCSTGQEVYSIAIELLEYLKDSPSSPAIQMFGSDISEWALTKARAGCYSVAAAADVPPDRLARYFTKEPLGYRINKSVRDLCVFAKHDVTADVPFSKMDLISCRNLLIYLAPVLQTKVFHTFHFALKSSGIMLLGSAESVGRSSDLFGTVDANKRIFKKMQTTRRVNTLPLITKREVVPPMTAPAQPSNATVTDLQRAADRIVLGRFAPAGVLINESLDIIQFRGQTHPYLEPAQGEASLNLLTMVPFGVADGLRAAIGEAIEHRVPVRRERVPMRRGDHFREIVFEVIPVLMPDGHAGSFLILFEEQDKAVLASPSAPEHALAQDGGMTADAREVLQLRSELTAAMGHIQSLAEQNRTLAEQLRAATEETSSTTEEFRSTNEELQTAKEEVDATNEELITVNEELRNSNHSLAKTMELTAAIVETMRYPLLVLDAELNVESANLAFLNAFHVSPENTLGRRIYQLGNGQWDIPELRRLLEDILPHNSAFDDFQVTHDFSDIGRRTMLVNARRLLGVHPLPRIVLVFADITEQNRIADDLKEKSRELARSNAELDQFAAVASHDLQEPLRMISNYVKMLDRRYAATFDDKAREYMGFVTSGADRMSEMITAILAYSRLGHQGSNFTETESDVSLHNALAILKRKIKEAKASITEGHLPKVMSNAEQLTQLFQNLLGNALKFRSDKRSPTVHVSAVESEHEWTFAVADNGIGMEAEHFEKIFQLFQRLNAASEYPGTGIGLATCKKIVEHHGGRIWVESQLDVGSTFYFTLPKSALISTRSGRQASL